MRLRPQIGHVGSMRQEIGNFEVSQPHEGGQGQVGGPQVPFLCREDKIETQNLVCREHRTRDKNFKLSQPRKGGQGQVGGAQVPRLGHGDVVGTPN